MKYSYWAFRTCLGILQWVSVRCLSKDWILLCLIKIRYWEISFQREMLLHSASAAGWKYARRHRAGDFVSTSNTERSGSFPFCVERENYSSDLLSPVLQTPLCRARDAWTGKVSTGRARVCFVWRLSVRSVRVWLIFLTRSLKCLGEHFNVNNVFCHFYNIFCLFAVSYQCATQKCLADNIHRMGQIPQNSSFSARDSRWVLSNANIELYSIQD